MWWFWFASCFVMGIVLNMLGFVNSFACVLHTLWFWLSIKLRWDVNWFCWFGCFLFCLLIVGGCSLFWLCCFALFGDICVWVLDFFGSLNVDLLVALCWLVVILISCCMIVHYSICFRLQLVDCFVLFIDCVFCWFVLCWLITLTVWIGYVLDLCYLFGLLSLLVVL